RAHAVPETGSIEASRAAKRPVARRDNETFALREHECPTDRLCARPLLYKQQLPARKLGGWIAERNNDLKWEDNRTIDVVMEAVEVTLSIAKHKRRRPSLTLRVAECEVILQVGRIGRRYAKSFHPAPRDRCKHSIERPAKLANNLRQRIGKIAVLTSSE